MHSRISSQYSDNAGIDGDRYYLKDDPALGSLCDQGDDRLSSCADWRICPSQNQRKHRNGMRIR